MSSQLPDAVPALLSALHDPERSVRYFAAQALGSIGAEPQLTVPKLLRVIAREKDLAPSSPGFACARALAKLGLRHAEQVVPVLVSELASGTASVVSGVAHALERIASMHEELVTSCLDAAASSENRSLQKRALSLKQSLATNTP